MSVIKALCGVRFWVGVILELIIVVAVNGISALLVVWGLLEADAAWYIHCAAWLLGAFGASRYAVAGTNGDGLAIGVVATLLGFAVVAITGLFVGEGTLPPGWIGYGLAALTGTMISGVIIPGKKRRKKRRSKLTTGKNRR